MKKIIMGFVLMAFLVMSSVAFAHPEVSDQGTGRDDSDFSGGEAVRDIANDNGQDNGLSNVVAGNPNCGAHPE